jgi:transglutaminase domain protein
MKKILSGLINLGILLIIIGLVINYKEEILNVYKVYILSANDKLSINNNKYHREYNFNYIKNTNNYSPKNRKEIRDIYYTLINSGQRDFTFFCPTSYKECISVVDEVGNDSTMLSHINNFTHPYNGFKHIETKYDNLGRVTIHIDKSYTDEQINEVDKKIDEVLNKIDKNLSIKEKIKQIHDYIINSTKYDKERSEKNIVKYSSDIAYGPLVEGFALCGGYTDAMELFLERLNIKSYKVSSENHVWNAVNLDGNWYNLDLTWDDPVASDGRNILDYSFFLIDTNKLHSIEKNEHNFDMNVYSELKGND